MIFDCIENSVETMYRIFLKLKNRYKFILTTKRWRQKIRESHCIRNCSGFIHAQHGNKIPECSGRHLYNDQACCYEEDLLYFCRDCPFLVKEELEREGV